MKKKKPAEAYLIVVRRNEEGPGRVLGCLQATSPDEASAKFHELRPGFYWDTITAIPLRVMPDEAPEKQNGRSWKQVEPGTWLYTEDETGLKVVSYGKVQEKCPDCEGSGCRECFQRGYNWVNKVQARNISRARPGKG